MTWSADPRAAPRLMFTRAELASAIGVPVSAIDQMVAEEFLPEARVWKSFRLWNVAEVETYLNGWPKMATPISRMVDPPLLDSQVAAEDAAVRSSHLWQRERDCLGTLAEQGFDKTVPWHLLKGAGTYTVRRLKTRGFVEIVADGPEEDKGLKLTPEGLAAWEAITQRGGVGSPE